MPAFDGWWWFLLVVVAFSGWHWLARFRRRIPHLDSAAIGGPPKLKPQAMPSWSDSPPIDPEKRYEIQETIGEGGMGVVRKAYDRTLRRFVAIKSLVAAPADEAKAARFVREARALACLNDPNIVTIYDVFESSTLGRCIVMELVNGESLRAVMGRGRLDIAATFDLGIQLSGALARVHEAGIVHRDLKPDNVMIAGESRLKILDFGIALMSARPFWPQLQEDSRLTESGTLVGTPSYMSPEQIRGEEVDSQTDVFSFGCILYELIAGRRPFMGPSVAAVFNAILNNAPDGLISSGIAVAPALEALVFDTLVKDRLARVISMKQIHDSLCRIRDSQADGAAPLTSSAEQLIPPLESELVEYLYIDRRRLDSYYRQLGPLRAVSGPKDVEEQARMLISGLQASDQLGVTRAVELDQLVAYEGTARWIRPNPFCIEVVDAVRLELPPRGEHDFGGLKIWVSESSPATGGAAGALYLIEDAPLDREIGASPGANPLSALMMLWNCVRGLRSVSFTTSSQEAVKAFSKDPVAFLEALGARVGASRRIRAFYRIRATFVDSEAPKGAVTTVGYPIVISEWSDASAGAGPKVDPASNVGGPTPNAR